MARAITTTNAHNHKQQTSAPAADLSTKVDEDYLHALKVRDEFCLLRDEF